MRTHRRSQAVLRVRPLGFARVVLALAALTAGVVETAVAQRVLRQPEQVVTVSKGTSALLVNPGAIQRFSIGDPTIAEAVVVSPSEVLINGKSLGATSLFLWDASDAVRLYSIEVTADAAGLQRYLGSVLPGEQIEVSATGNVVTLSGQVRDGSTAIRAVEIAKGSGATIIDNLTTPDAIQVLLHVRFAEIQRSALKEFQAQLRTFNPQNLDDSGNWLGSTNTDPATGGFVNGLFNLGLFSAGSSIETLISALKTKGQFRTLAEPTLVTLPGREAYFLAGGEFPYPTVQSGGGQSVTIVFKEFGIRLRFTPTLTRNGSIRLKLAPEVSSLDFANALVIAGFTIPSLLTRRAETEVEMRDGQYLSIAGLLDNSLIENATKIPILGDLPIIGQFFRTKDKRERRTELLVLVTPQIVRPSNVAQELPTGEPGTWRWDGSLKDKQRPEATSNDSTPQ